MWEYNYTDELYHLGTKKKHKYIAKVRMKNGKYRYFYDKKAYQSYLDKKQNKNKKFDSKNKDYQKVVLHNLLAKIGDMVPDITKMSEKALEYADKMLNGPITVKPKKDHKYVAKVKLADGKYRYFYSDEEYERYKDRVEAMKNEPDFMKNIPKIDQNTIMSSEDDMAEINEDFSPFSMKSSMNCMYCTNAYELRSRGYDVEAADFPEDDPYSYKGTFESIYDFYESPKVERIKSDGSVEKYKYRSNYTQDDYDSEATTYTTSSLRKAIEKNNPPNSRGNICVYWNGGGAHSMIWETDSKGKLTIKDAQSNRVRDMEYIAKASGVIYYYRSDNLKLKEGVLETVKRN